MGVRIFLQIRSSVGIALLCGDVGGYPLCGTGTRGVPGPGGTATDERLPRRRGDGSGITPGHQQQERRRGLRQWERTPENAEYDRAVHCYAIAYGYLQGGAEKAGGTGRDAVARTGGHCSDEGKGDGSNGNEGGQ